MTKLLPIGVTVNKKNKCSMNDYGSISSSSLPLQKIRAIIVDWDASLIVKLLTYMIHVGDDLVSRRKLNTRWWSLFVTRNITTPLLVHHIYNLNRF